MQPSTGQVQTVLPVCKAQENILKNCVRRHELHSRWQRSTSRGHNVICDEKLGRKKDMEKLRVEEISDLIDRNLSS